MGKRRTAFGSYCGLCKQGFTQKDKPVVSHGYPVHPWCQREYERGSRSK